jgi:hypothetical protein
LLRKGLGFQNIQAQLAAGKGCSDALTLLPLLVRTNRSSRFSRIHITSTECFLTQNKDPRLIKRQDVTRLPLLGSREVHILAGLQASKKLIQMPHHSR